MTRSLKNLQAAAPDPASSVETLEGIEECGSVERKAKGDEGGSFPSGVEQEQSE
jgi:hypothetical protein